MNEWMNEWMNGITLFSWYDSTSSNCQPSRRSAMGAAWSLLPRRMGDCVWWLFRRKRRQCCLQHARIWVFFCICIAILLTVLVWWNLGFISRLLRCTGIVPALCIPVTSFLLVGAKCSRSVNYVRLWSLLRSPYLVEFRETRTTWLHFGRWQFGSVFIQIFIIFNQNPIAFT